jgi:hypothetical protein
MHRFLFILGSVACLFILTASSAFALDPQESENVDLLGSTPQFDHVEHLVVDGDYVYMACWWDGLFIIDISDPTRPTIVANYVDYCVADVAVADGYACLAAENPSYLVILDVTDPTNPVFVTEFSAWTPTWHSIGRIKVDGDVAYLFCTFPSNVIRIIDISTPASPYWLATYDNPHRFGSSFDTSSDLMIIPSKEVPEPWEFLGYDIVDIENPSNPHSIGFLNITNSQSPNGVAISNNVFYAAENFFLRTVDISDPATPEVTSVIDINSGFDVFVSGDYLYLTELNDGLKIFDLVDPLHPVLVGQIETDVYEISDFASCVVHAGNHAIVAERYSGSILIDVSVPDQPQVSGFLQSLYSVQQAAVANGYTYIAQGISQPGGMYVLDISDPAQPASVGFLPTDYYSNLIVVEGNTGYLGEGGHHQGIHTLDLSTPSDPVQLSFYPMPERNLQGMYLSGNYLYVAQDTEGLAILDVTDTLPVEIARITDINKAWDVKVRDNLAYISDEYGGLLIVDVSTPSAPVTLGSVALIENSLNLDLDGDYAYICIENTGVQVVDISDPSAPTVINYFDLPFELFEPDDIEVVDGFAYVTDHRIRLYVFDVSDPTNILESGYHNSFSRGRALIVQDDLIYLAEQNCLEIFQFHPPTGPFYVNLIPASNPTVVQQGSVFEYSATIRSNEQPPPFTDIWTMAHAPGGGLIGPIWRINHFPIGVTGTITANGIWQQVPIDAPTGVYTFGLRVGDYPSTVLGQDTFLLEVVEAEGATVAANQWSAGGYEFLSELAEPSITPGAEYIPQQYSISAAYPNPFNSATTLHISLPVASELSVEIFNVTGQRVTKLADGPLHAGNHHFTFDASGLASGLYFVRATVPGKMEQVQKVLLVR